jgi:branched-chain amino acid transport system permease protein
VSVEALLGAIVGGIGTVWGPLLGAGVLHLLGELTRGLVGDAPGINLVVYGIVLILMVTFMPRGIVGFFVRRPRRKLVNA